MKIAATDFDGTLCPIGEPIPEGNIRAIKAWQAAGNKFGIATGRGLSLIREAVNQYDDLKLDFLVCNNGAVSLDEQGNMMHCQAIAPDVLRGLLSMDVVQDERYSLLVFTAHKVYSIRPNPLIPIELIPPISVEQALQLSDVVQISMKFTTPEEAQQVSDDIHAKYPSLGGNINRSYLDINDVLSDKGWGLQKMLDSGAWKGKELLVIGDDKNDLPMIERFQGFTVATAKPFMQEAAAKVYDTVGAMLMDNL